MSYSFIFLLDDLRLHLKTYVVEKFPDDDALQTCIFDATKFALIYPENYINIISKKAAIIECFMNRILAAIGKEITVENSKSIHDMLSELVEKFCGTPKEKSVIQDFQDELRTFQSFSVDDLEEKLKFPELNCFELLHTVYSFYSLLNGFLHSSLPYVERIVRKEPCEDVEDKKSEVNPSRMQFVTEREKREEKEKEKEKKNMENELKPASAAVPSSIATPWWKKIGEDGKDKPAMEFPSSWGHQNVITTPDTLQTQPSSTSSGRRARKSRRGKQDEGVTVAEPAATTTKEPVKEKKEKEPVNEEKEKKGKEIQIPKPSAFSWADTEDPSIEKFESVKEVKRSDPVSQSNSNTEKANALHSPSSEDSAVSWAQFQQGSSETSMPKVPSLWAKKKDKPKESSGSDEKSTRKPLNVAAANRFVVNSLGDSISKEDRQKILSNSKKTTN